MILVYAVLLALYTGVLGTLAILLCILVPGGRAAMPLVRLWSWLVIRTFRVTYSTVYDPNLDPGRPAVYVANHQSHFDIPVLALAMPTDFRMIAKRELLHVPVFGWALWLAGFVFIDRGDRDRAIRSLDRTIRKFRRGTSVVVFPEGMRSPDGSLLPFKKGAFMMALQAGVPIVPVSLRGGRAILPKGSLQVRPGRIEVVFGTPIETSEYEIERKDELIALTHERIASGLLPDPRRCRDPDDTA